MRIALTIAVLLAAHALGAAVVDVSPAPVSPFPDTEVSTNIVINVHRSDARSLDVRIQIDGTPSNNLEVAFGRDSNTNGVLDVSEIHTVYGWRGGRYVVEDFRGWSRIESAAATNGLCGTMMVHIENDSEAVPRRFSATCGGATAFSELSASAPAWLYRREWDTMRVVRRGAEVSGDWISCDIGYQFFMLKVR